MKNRKRWVIVDVETDGLHEPIHVVELSGQLLEGWEPVGEAFRMLLNHDVPIPPEVVAIHGYTQEYLRQHGRDPLHVHRAFGEYARDYPLVAHNLSFDWNRCLEPEWARLRIPQIGQRGFCCMMLARRLVPETSSYRLDSLKECFRLTPTRSHRAKNDVLAIVELFNKAYRPRWERAGLDTFESVADFARRTPVAKCLDLIRRGSRSAPPPPPPKDEWYYRDAAKNAHGPLSAREIDEGAGLEAYHVYREGMADWAANHECPEFIAYSQAAPAAPWRPQKSEAAKSIGELVGVCRGLIADDKLTTAEVLYLNSWLQDAGCLTEWPASEIAQTMERILDDGVVAKGEKEELKRLIQAITGTSAAPGAQATPQDSQEAPPVLTARPGTEHFTIVVVKQGSRDWLEWRHGGVGASDAPAVMGENPWKSATELLHEKRGPVPESRQNAAMARGTRLEPEARRHYIAKTGKDVQPACLQSRQRDWLRASVDGLSSNGGTVVEIKCGESVYQRVSEAHCVPNHSYGQLQHILAVTGLPSIDFWCYLPGCPELLVPVARDDTYLEGLLRAESEFWSRVQQRR